MPTLDERPVIIGTAFPPAGLRRHLAKARAAGGQQGVALSIEEAKDGRFHAFICRVQPQERMGEGLACLAGHVADALQNDLQRVWPRRLLRVCVGRVPAVEAAAILNRAKAVPSPSRAHLATAVEQILAARRHFTIEGFVRFRLRESLRTCQQVLAQAARQVRLEQEYRAFVHLLQEVVAEQVPQIETVQVIRGRGGAYSLADAWGRRVATDFLDGPIAGQAQSLLDREDLLVSALLQLAPARIVCHFAPAPGECALVRDIFGDRVDFCNGCSACLSYN